MAQQSSQRCWDCTQTKALEEFPTAGKAGRSRQCRECHRVSVAARYRADVVAGARRSRESTARRRKKDPVRHAVQQMLFAAKARAKRKGIPFNITESDIFAGRTCPVLGIELRYMAVARGRRGPGQNSPSLDRIDPALGYVRGNVMVISMKANAIKNNATADELRLVAQYVTAFSQAG